MLVDRTGRRAARIATVALNVTWWAGLPLSVVFVGVLLAAPLLEQPGFVPRFDWNSFHVRGGSGPPAMGLRVSVADDAVSGLPSLSSPDTMRASNPVPAPVVR